MNNELSIIQSVKIRFIRQIRERIDLRKCQVPTYRKNLYFIVERIPMKFQVVISFRRQFAG